ncbi:MAG: hypothetical protein AABX11_06160 [Nanoarchaeota archaeon]
MRDKGHMEFVERWANFIKDKPQEEWRPKFNEFIDAQFDMARRFRENMSKTEEGREALQRVIEWRKTR